MTFKVILKIYLIKSKYFKSNCYACKRFTLPNTPKICNQGPNLPNLLQCFHVLPNYTFNVPWQVRDESYPFSPSPHVLKCPFKVYTSSLSTWIGLWPFTFNVFPTCLNTIKHLQRLIFPLDFLALHKINFTLNQLLKNVCNYQVFMSKLLIYAYYSKLA